MSNLKDRIKACQVCVDFLPYGVNPVCSFSSKSKILVIGQAPGSKVHQTGIPWDDPSGKRLREWLGINNEVFYDEGKLALVPMGFCYPGNGKSGDLPPRPECAPLWHQEIMDQIEESTLTLLIGQYAQKYYLRGRVKPTLTETVRNYEQYLPLYLPLPHPSPRNNIWLKKNPWFVDELLPTLQRLISKALK